MSSNLPVIISVPHGGEIIAPEMTDRTLLSREDIFSDGDPLTRKIYNFRKEVSFYFESTIARATVDLNRPPNDLPPLNRDGVVKSHTVTGKGIYRKNRIPGKDSLRLLLKKYYTPYHERLWKNSRKANLFCGIDCHTMLDRAPVISNQPGRQRPFICLSNRGDQQGNRVMGRRLTCPPEMIRSLGLFMREQFPDEADNITLNDPFLGGYIIQRHSHNLPWIQIELNRRAYLAEEWYDQRTLQVCRKRIVQLRCKFLAAIRNFVQYNHLPQSLRVKVA
jgi:N-formylglutamate deformylase